MLKKGDVLAYPDKFNKMGIHIIMETGCTADMLSHEFLTVMSHERQKGCTEWKKNYIRWPYKDDRYVVRNKTRLRIIYNSLIDHFLNEFNYSGKNISYFVNMNAGIVQGLLNA